MLIESVWFKKNNALASVAMSSLPFVGESQVWGCATLMAFS